MLDELERCKQTSQGGEFGARKMLNMVPDENYVGKGKWSGRASGSITDKFSADTEMVHLRAKTRKISSFWKLCNSLSSASLEFLKSKK
ncbi:hypothetical protein TNCV_1066101 [Trichonephila clavipes]|nr:hypothetical protein TNCV_1066101 [Trichonephila clavipes]